jgi:hypothetical protein
MGNEVIVNRVDTSDTTGNEFIIKFVGDFHYGSRTCNEEAIKKEIEKIRRNKAKIVLMGDLIDCGTKHSIGGGSFDNSATPQEQFEKVTEWLEPIKDKILGAHIGNHEERVYNETSINLTKNMCSILGIKYFGHSVFHHIRFGKNTYTGYSTHGSSGATMTYTKIRAAIRLSEFFTADFYAHAHLHFLETFINTYHTVNLKDKTLEERKRYFLLTGGYLNYKGSYAEAKNYGPTRVGCAWTTFDKNKWNITIGTD